MLHGAELGADLADGLDQIESGCARRDRELHEQRAKLGGGELDHLGGIACFGLVRGIDHVEAGGQESVVRGADLRGERRVESVEAEVDLAGREQAIVERALEVIVAHVEPCGAIREGPEHGFGRAPGARGEERVVVFRDAREEGGKLRYGEKDDLQGASPLFAQGDHLACVEIA